MKKIVSAIKKAVVHLNILGLLFIIACGSDNPVNNGNNPPVVTEDSLKASFDSLTLYVNGLNTNDTNLYNVFNVGDSIKVVLTAETNCSATDTAYVGIFVGNISATLTNSDIPRSFVYYGLYPSSSSGVAFNLYLKTTSLRYLKIKNVKLYKVNPV